MQNNCFIFFRMQWFIKERGVQICPPLVSIGLSEFDTSYTRWWCDNSFFCNYYCSQWNQKHGVFHHLLQKISLEKPLFELDTFSKPLALQDRYFLQRPDLFVFYVTTIFLNFHELWRSNLFACFDIAFLQLGITTKTRNKFAK